MTSKEKDAKNSERNPDQRKRLATEKDILDRYFPKHFWVNPKDKFATQVRLPFRTVGGNEYEVTIMIPADYPITRPDLFLTAPKPAYTYQGVDLAKVGISDAMHLLQPSSDGYPQLCHCRPDQWSNNTTLYQIFLKAIMWLQAFDFHRTTGKDMTHFLKEMSWNRLQERSSTSSTTSSSSGSTSSTTSTSR